MGKNGGFAALFITLVLLVAHNSEAAALNHLRKLFTAEVNISAAQKVSPIASPVNESNANPMNAEKPVHQSDDTNKGASSSVQIGQEKNEKNNTYIGVIQSSGKNNVNTSDSDGTASAKPDGEDNSDSTSGSRSGGVSNLTKPALGSTGSCEGSLPSCKDQGMLACLETSKESKQLFLVVQNQGKSTLKVSATLSDPTIGALPILEVPTGETRKMSKGISSTITTVTVTVTSGKAQCMLHLGHPGYRFHLVQPLSFYSMQISPIYSIYGAGVLVLVLGGVVTCCKIHKRKKQDGNGIPYQELEMGLPAPASAQGWDDDWDNDDWDEGTAVVSPAARGRASGNGLISRSAAKEGWDD